MTPTREQIEEIFHKWYAAYGFDLPQEGVAQIIDALLALLNPVVVESDLEKPSK